MCARMRCGFGARLVDFTQILGDAREGDILRQNPDGSYQTDTAATQARREKLAARTRRLMGK